MSSQEDTETSIREVLLELEEYTVFPKTCKKCKWSPYEQYLIVLTHPPHLCFGCIGHRSSAQTRTSPSLQYLQLLRPQV